MLEAISIKNVATYDTSGIQISNLKKVNFIYGANGCGKTTLSKLISEPSSEIYAGCTLHWRGGLPVKTLVYNKDFRERNFGKGKIDGVFTLGQATKEHIEAINKMETDLANVKEQGIKASQTLKQQEELKIEYEATFREIVWTDIYKKYEGDFKEAFSGYMKKDSFRDKMLSEYLHNTNNVLKYDELKEKAQTIFGKAPATLPFITNIDFAKLLEIESDKLWRKKIIGKSDVEIAALIQRLNLNDWVNEGRAYLEEDDTCPFCQQKTITASFREQLDSYFDETFTRDTESVKSLSTEYDRIYNNLLNVLQQIEAREKLNAETKLHLDEFSATLKTLSNQLILNRELLNNKLKEPSRSIELTSTTEQLEEIKKLIISTNKEIKTHNDIVSDYTNQRNSLISNIWRYLVECHRTVIDDFAKRKTGFDKAIKGIGESCEQLRGKYSVLKDEIREANKNVTSIQPSIDEINKILKLYGFTNFELVPSKTEINQYQIKREDGTIAEATLSEGETTFITFLYFLQQAKGSTQQESITEERILIVDDPISSLDSTILFVVSSLIKNIIKGIREDKGSIKQLILLTHNVYFHKEVSYIGSGKLKDKDTNFWILRRNSNRSSVQAFEMENPIQNSYELLWRELDNPNNNSGLTIQNIMRRIIENYFKILGHYGDDNLVNSFNNPQDQEICRSLVCWINDGSHSIPDDLYIQQHDDTMDRYFDVFERIFIQMGHESHYTMMRRAPAKIIATAA